MIWEFPKIGGTLFWGPLYESQHLGYYIKIPHFRKPPSSSKCIKRLSATCSGVLLLLGMVLHLHTTQSRSPLTAAASILASYKLLCIQDTSATGLFRVAAAASFVPAAGVGEAPWSSQEWVSGPGARTKKPDPSSRFGTSCVMPKDFGASGLPWVCASRESLS